MRSENDGQTQSLSIEQIESSHNVELLAPGTRLADRYEIVEALGSGGFAVVYRAIDRVLRAEIALKVLRRDRSSREAVARFRREVNATPLGS